MHIDMNPPDHQSHKEAVLLSPHKFIGGVGAAGVLIAKKAMFRNPVPNGGGGGSVSEPCWQRHQYSG